MKSSSLRRNAKLPEAKSVREPGIAEAASRPPRTSLGSTILVLAPTRWMELGGSERNWISDAVRELGLRWGNICVAFDPGFPRETRSGILFPTRAFNDFRESVKEVLFDNYVSAVVAIGEAANAYNLHLVMGWSPMVKKASVFLGPDLLRSDIGSASELSDLVIHHAPAWNGAGQGWGQRVCMVNGPHEIADVLREKFGLVNAYAPGAYDLGAEGMSVVVDGRANRRRDLGLLKAGFDMPLEVIEARNAASDPRRTPVCALNNALRRARHRYVLYLNHSITSQGLRRALSYLLNDPLLAIVGGVPFKGSAVPTNGSKAPGLVNGGRERKEFSKTIPSPFAGWLIRRGAMARVGFLDEEFRSLSFAMFDYCLRLRQMGLRVYTAAEVPFIINTAAGRVQSKSNGGRESLPDMKFLMKKWAMPGPQMKTFFAKN